MTKNKFYYKKNYCDFLFEIKNLNIFNLIIFKKNRKFIFLKYKKILIIFFFK